MTGPDLSIVAIIPLYNGARWIEGSIRSVLAQTLAPDEFIVVDDGSTDDGAGAAIVEKLALEHPAIRLLRKPNGGQSSARNFGVAHSRSALIALLDQDDAWYPHHLETLVGPFRNPRGVPLGWVYSNIDLVTEDGWMYARDHLSDLPVEQPKRHVLRCLSEDMHILPSASLISREAFDSVGGFDERLSGYEDDDLFLRIFCAHWQNIYLPESLSFWRQNNSSSSYTPRMAKSRMIYARKLIANFPDDTQRNLHFARDCIAPKFFAISTGDYVNAIRKKDYKTAHRALADMAEIAPYMRTKTRVTFFLAKPFLQHPFIGRVMLGAKPYLDRVYRAIFA